MPALMVVGLLCLGEGGVGGEGGQTGGQQGVQEIKRGTWLLLPWLVLLQCHASGGQASQQQRKEGGDGCLAGEREGGGGGGDHFEAVVNGTHEEEREGWRGRGTGSAFSCKAQRESRGESVKIKTERVSTS